MRFHVLTLFPEMIDEAVTKSITGRAVTSGFIKVNTVNIRDHSACKHKKTDDYPYGGGAGMLMTAQPIYDAYMAIKEQIGTKKPRTIYLTPQGKLFDQKVATSLAAEDDLILLCGHYEGVDERVIEEITTDQISIGDYVLTGGELAALVVIDAVTRLLPGVLGNAESIEAESLSGFLLEQPQYTRPRSWQGKDVPEILLSGDHAKIIAWQKNEAIKRTKARRPDLYEKWKNLQ
ncbi:MAG: tRNA (guanosine(37)-N1)-methyltransferase TrmD [Lachnospiraceae bacterium]|nr:tRNA (guanosine(37)-N1)-methyltransferase TrmD [Lachnospiraceae bacterium]